MSIEKKPENSRTRQARMTKQKIYRVAISLFSKYGYHNVTIQDICRKAGVATGVFYHYYSNKAAVIVEMVSSRDQRMEHCLDDCTAVSPKERIRELFSCYARATAEIGVDAIRVLYNPDDNAKKKEKDCARDDIGSMIFQLDRLVEQGIEAGELRCGYDRGTIVHLLAITLRGIIYDWCRNDGDYDLETVLPDHIGVLLSLFSAADVQTVTINQLEDQDAAGQE